MENWLYYDATHARHVLCNPIAPERVDELGRVLGLAPGARVLDIACGFGECLVRWAVRHGVTGVGVDLSPYAIARAETRRRERAPAGDLVFRLGAGADFRAGEPFDVAMCLGASWIWQGFEGTLRALRGFVRAGGHVVSGEPFWIAEPPDEYLRAEGLRRDELHSLEGCAARARALGLETLWRRVSTPEDWDAYELTQMPALEEFAAAHPDHPDLPAMRARRALADDAYRRWGRDHCGYATWVFRTA